jgi:putative flippase GtrA
MIPNMTEQDPNKSKVRRASSRGLSLLAESIEFSPTHDVGVQVIRSLVVSVIALFFDFSTLVILKELGGINYLLAAALSFCLGVVINYFLSVTWVFAHRKFSKRHTEFLIFLAINVMGLILNLIIISGMVQWMSVDYRVAKLVATIIVFFWNFIARKRILY